nr:PREDICTED: putative helicase Mov10l1 [Latimeria chalumnae]|eukprot:XP_014351818.1 PREDICTED: putative helicase Mov10l1 [Latimeria chalumnae]
MFSISLLARPPTIRHITYYFSDIDHVSPVVDTPSLSLLEPCNKVEPFSDQWENDGSSGIEYCFPDSTNTKALIGSVTSCSKNGGYINETTYFSLDDVCEGFEPYKGDWVQAQYYINPTTWSSQACYVKPLRYKRVDKVKISTFLGTMGVIDGTIFFTMDSLRLPENYMPRKDDLVSVVVVESTQSCYMWRALCMAPIDENGISGPSGICTDEPIEAVLMRNKGGLEVSRMTHFGPVKQGESKDMVILIENKGNVTHKLLSCKLAGLEKGSQFKVELQDKDKLASSAMEKKMVEPKRNPTQPVQLKGVLPYQSLGNTTKAHSVTWPNTAFCIGYGPMYLANTFMTHQFPLAMCPLVPAPLGYCMPHMPLQVISPFHSTSYTGGRGIQMKDADLMTTNRYSPLQDQSGVSNVKESQNDVEQELTSVRSNDQDIVIPPGGAISLIITCEAKNLGRCKELLLLCFMDFIIGRYLEVNIVSEEECLIAATSPYHPVKYKLEQDLQPEQYKQVVTVHSTKRLLRRQLTSFLPHYPVPQKMRVCVESKTDVLVVEPSLAEPLNMSNYQKRFSALLWLEEIQAEMEINEFKMTGVIFKKNGNLLVLEVPGLAEGRPSVYIGDKVILKYPGYSSVAVEYSGLVTEIHEEEISLSFNSQFQETYDGEPMDVEYTLNRTTSRRCHFAVQQAPYLGETVLFPDKLLLQSPQVFSTWNESVDEVVDSDSNKQYGKVEDIPSKEAQHKNVEEKTIFSISDMVSVGTQTKKGRASGTRVSKKKECKFFNPMLNDHQKLAVKRILSGECRPIPYILFGPPGTGKTMTIIEAVLQIHYTLPGSRILACTPSNGAADLLCLRLHESNVLQPGDMVRVNATYRMEESVSDIVKMYSRNGENISQASRFRIIICTCSTAGLFCQIGIRIGHFTHVFVDEAGQATEPECLIPLVMVSEENGQVCMCILFQVTKLVKNYRSHAVLLNLPSELFYDKELKVCGDESVVNALCKWEKLPTKEFPIICHGLRGNEIREGNNPSWFNPAEAVQVMRYCCLLAKHGTEQVSVSDIGVIAPYKKQVEKIRILLRSVDLPEIKVGSVEEFQGQEYLVIIISTVRSSENKLDEDMRYVLGFLSNPKRFNVAITRPKALLIIVGNPHILVKDPCFSAFLEYCIVNGAYVGCNLPLELESLQRLD